MMNFKDIKRYSNYTSYQRIQRIKHQQCNKGLNKKCQYRSYQDYLDRKDGLVCCPVGIRKADCAYTGILGKSDCFTSMLTAVQFIPGSVGYDGMGGGTLLPLPSWDGFSVVSFVQSGVAGGPWNLQVKGADVSGVTFDCIELTQGDTKIQLFQSEATTASIGPPGEGATEHFIWTGDAVHPPGAKLTPGSWIFRLCQCRC